ncbi:hypothetical protein PR202_gb26843 [Eleusine coracana subsp. coracana]|uniref:F-box domain-containing protein n=1 Tax=Eleusine coracana subsp. coracana TaxID=191504 RepID=A0AAV5FSZ4_ELECO|nr:hypothetical protein PR202_gb26843 [Eleusine coracana subsp. coracana]
MSCLGSPAPSTPTRSAYLHPVFSFLSNDLSMPEATHCQDVIKFIPADLVLRIFGTLEVPDLLSAAAVCRSWRSGYKLDHRLDVSPLFRGPCLVFSTVDREADAATLLCLSDGKRHHVTLPNPPFRSRYVVGSSHGWLVTADEQSELSLVNPITRAQIALPPVKTMKNVGLRFTKNKVLHSYVLYHMDVSVGLRNRYMFARREFYDPDEARHFLYKRVALSADPSSGNCIVMIIHWFQDLMEQVLYCLVLVFI